MTKRFEELTDKELVEWWDSYCDDIFGDFSHKYIYENSRASFWFDMGPYEAIEIYKRSKHLDVYDEWIVWVPSGDSYSDGAESFNDPRPYIDMDALEAYYLEKTKNDSERSTSDWLEQNS